MDNTENSSECSETSKESECLSSDTTSSTVSGLGNYQGEFLELQQVITDVDKHNKHITKSEINTCTTFQNNNKNTHSHVHEENKVETCKTNNQVNNLLQRNNHLQISLETANKQIQRLLSIYSTKNDQSEITTLQHKIVHLEKINYDLNLQNSILTNDFNQIKHLKNDLEYEAKHFRTTIADLNLELATKINCISELKNKIAEQHVTLQNRSQQNNQLNQSLDSLRTQLDFVVKSEKWYKEELHQLQKDKVELLQEIVKKTKTIACQDEELDHLKLEVNKWQCICDETRLASLKEKESILRQFGGVTNPSDNCTSKETITCNPTGDVVDHQVKMCYDYESTTIEELKRDVSILKDNFESQQVAFENLTKENCELLAKYLALQGCVKERECMLEKMDLVNKDLKNRLTIALDKEQMYNKDVLDFKRLIANLEIELKVERQEKDNIVETIKNLKEQFKHLSRLKLDKAKESKEIQCQLQLQPELNNNSNLKTTEVEKVNNKPVEQPKIDEIKQIQKNDVEEIVGKKDSAVQHLEPLANQNCLLSMCQSSFSQLDFTSYVNFDVDELSCTKNLLIYISTLCDKYNNVSSPYDVIASKNSKYEKMLLMRIEAFFQQIDDERVAKFKIAQNLQSKVKKLKKLVCNKIQCLDEKCKTLGDKNEANSKMLTLLSEGNKNDEIQHLQAMLQVKIREQQDKQKRYETNNRTLLRKVKEHMKGRNVAEKHTLHLQELYNNLFDQHNTLLLKLNSKDSEIAELQTRLEHIQKLYKCHKDLSSSCEKCIELEITKGHEKELEVLLKKCESCKERALNELKVKEELIDNLRAQNQDLLSELAFVNDERKKIITTIKTLESSLLEKESLMNDLDTQLTNERENYLKLSAHNNSLSKEIEKTNEKNSYMLGEIEHMNSRLHLKDEELKELRMRKEQLERNWSKKEMYTQNVITALKSQLQSYSNEIDERRNEKFFLQRLCNDLKIAVQVHVNQNKVLKEYVNNNVAKEKESLPIFLSDFPSPTKYDDFYINRLLVETRMPSKGKPLSDIQESLDSLRNEIVFLQQKIIAKNIA